MVAVRIEYQLADYDSWKAIFDSDPAGRRQAGVRSYRITRSQEDPAHVCVELTFDDEATAAPFRAAIEALWDDPRVGQVISGGRTEILSVIEEKGL